MLYAATTFWLLVIVFVAYGVYQLWSGLLKPKTINVLLLPGTLVAQIGHVIGMLVTGGTINNATLIKDDDSGEPSACEDVNSKIPVFGPIVVALLPILACGLSIYLVINTIGQSVISQSEAQPASQVLPTSFMSVWDLLRDSITVVEQVTMALFSSDFTNWHTWLFLYLIICLSVRLAPMPGMQRGAVGAIFVLGLGSAIIGLATQVTEESIQGIWNTMSFAVAILLFLMIITLIVRGGVGLFKIMTNQA